LIIKRRPDEASLKSSPKKRIFEKRKNDKDRGGKQEIDTNKKAGQTKHGFKEPSPLERAG